jgi:NADPH2:quinone reductase
MPHGTRFGGERGGVPINPAQLAIHTRERQFTRIFHTLYGQKSRQKTRLPVRTKAIRIHETGGPEVLRLDDVSVPDPGALEARIEQKAVGVNFIDIYQRRGLYPLPSLPAVIGMEAAGVVEAVGGGVRGFAVGDRVAYAARPPGAYTGLRNLKAEQLVKLPDEISLETGAAMMLKGMTAEYLVRRSYAVQPGETVLVHAAAGGVGLIQCQWLNHLGATVIGTVGSEDKAKLAKAHGCHHPINYRSENFVERVQALTDGRGVSVVYDSVGRETFEGSLACLSPHGVLVLFGQSSGSVENLAPGVLAAQSITLVRPGLFDQIATRAALEDCSGALFEVVREGVVRIEISQTYPLAEAARAHEDLEGRRTTGSIVLIP